MSVFKCFAHIVKHDKLDFALWCENVHGTQIISLFFELRLITV